MAHERLSVDAHASGLNAVTPRYITAADPPSTLVHVRDVGLWLNPAYGPKCKTIEATLEQLLSGAVAERGCTLVALLPLYSFKTWCAASTCAFHLA